MSLDLYKAYRYMECISKCRSHGVSEKECQRICEEIVFEK